MTDVPRADLTFLPARGHQRMPWANGGGETIELLRAPAGSTLETMDWRISVATLAEPGDFSTFAGIDRTLVLIDDATIELEIDGAAHRLRRYDQVSFDGASATRTRLISRPCRDLNVMCRHGRYAARVTPFRLDQGWPRPTEVSDLVAWVFLRGSARLDLDGLPRELEPLDVLFGRGTPPWTGAGDAVCVELHTAAALDGDPAVSP